MPSPCHLHATPHPPQVPENVRKAFAMFDTDRSGDIDRYELKQALRQLGMEADSAQTQGIIQKYDTTGRGKLDLAAFNKLVTELLAFQKTGNPKAKPDEKSTLSAPLRLVVFAAANDKGGGRRELVHLVVERMRTHRAHSASEHVHCILVELRFALLNLDARLLLERLCPQRRSQVELVVVGVSELAGRLVQHHRVRLAISPQVFIDSRSVGAQWSLL